ncbi:Phosphate transport system regulatory protein PhoU (plasmid) [Acidisarcina polymorpha]|uniref:Phosphate transport system regulatory protein PhoU n=2 Tax=Acidisarcina polymorpha TaxID=2211140 RepID=A0A2Z5GAN4_9BACT|nr:Phosphate transport system regulatory protein PhoU [Acidisarcina polymorpha]
MGIAHRALDLLVYDTAELPVDIAGMGEVASRMICTAVQALLEADAFLAESVMIMDDEIDQMNRVARKGLIGVIQQTPDVMLQALNGILIAEPRADRRPRLKHRRRRNLLVRGADVRHQLRLAMD